VSVYADSSAVLGWLLEEASAPAIRDLFIDADHVVASDLTLIECDRALMRAAALGEISEAECSDKRALLQSISVHWHVLRAAGKRLGLDVVP
jgi:predicted nucleic acid-binding protein